MSDSVVNTIITVLGSVFSSMLLVNWRLKKLEDKVDQHNGWAEKFQAQSTDIAVIKTDIKYLTKVIEGKE